MKIIKKLIEQMDDELNGAEEYAEGALKYKEKDKILADLYFNMSLQEMKHHDDLHMQVVRMISEYRKEHGEPPVAMQAVYDWEHEKAIDRAKEIKTLQGMYK